MDNRDVTNIAATLKYGWFDGKQNKLTWIVYSLFSLLCVGGLIFAIIMATNDFDSGSDSLIKFIFIMIGGSIGLLFLPIIFLVMLLKNNSHKKEILLWMEDAVELTAFSGKIGEKWGVPPVYKIRVEFEYNGNKLYRDSTCKPIGGGMIENGYQRVWKDYLDKKIRIFYSPKYDQVMVINN